MRLSVEQREVTRNSEIKNQANGQDIEGRSEKLKPVVPHTTPCGDTAYFHGEPHTPQGEQNLEVFMEIRNEIKSYIVREGVTMTEIVEKLADDRRGPLKVDRLCGERRSDGTSELSASAGSEGYEVRDDESESVPNFSGKLQRGSLRYTEAVQLADALGYDLVWVKRGKGGR